MTKLFKNLKAGLDEALAYEKGKIHLRSIEIEVPEPPAKYRAKDIKKLRHKKHYSQGILSKILNVSLRTVQSWESGQRMPSDAALRLLELVDKGIYSPEIHKHR